MSRSRTNIRARANLSISTLGVQNGQCQGAAREKLHTSPFWIGLGFSNLAGEFGPTCKRREGALREAAVSLAFPFFSQSLKIIQARPAAANVA